MIKLNNIKYFELLFIYKDTKMKIKKKSLLIKAIRLGTNPEFFSRDSIFFFQKNQIF